MTDHATLACTTVTVWQKPVVRRIEAAGAQGGGGAGTDFGSEIS